MSNPLPELQSILSGRTSVAGKIISTANGVARVATAQGVVAGWEGLGDRVSVQDGRAVRVQEAVAVPIFVV